MAETAKVAVEPTAIDWLVAGCKVITGAPSTVKLTMELVTEPPKLVTITE